MKDYDFNPLEGYNKVCPFCQRDFTATHMNQKFCKEFEGRKGFCKDHYNHPRINRKMELRDDVIKSLSQANVPYTADNHKEAVWWLKCCLECDFEEVIEEFSIGGGYAKKVDCCVKHNKIDVGVELILAENIGRDVSSIVNELQDQLMYASNYFEKQLVVAIVGDRNALNVGRLKLFESQLSKENISYVFIQVIK